MPTPFPLKLGKKPPKYDPRALLFAKYLTSQLPGPKGYSSWEKGITNWGMYLNDKIGDCTFAGMAHHFMTWKWNSAKQLITFNNQDILNGYITVTGEEGAAYNPQTGANDNGCVELDVLRYCRSIGLGGHKIGAWADIEPGAIDHVQIAIDLFGGVYIGLALPNTAQNQVGSQWAVVPNSGSDGQPGSWGGHAVPVIEYDRWGLTCVTWGALQRMTWNFWKAYCDEAHVIFAPDWFNGNLPAPSGFDMQTLQADLRLLAG